MKVLVAHNRYSSDKPSGENRVVDEEIVQLRRHGVEVVSYLPSSDDLRDARSKVVAGLGAVSHRSGVRAVQGLMERERPDVLHVHNVFPLISPQVLRIAKRLGIPRVQTVHNHRHGCCNGLLFRDGRVCLDCLKRPSQLPGVLHGCYRESRLQSLLIVSSASINAATWRDLDGYLVLTPYLRDYLIDRGFPADRILVKPVAVSNPGERRHVSEPRFLYVGRLEEAKGVELLLQAWSRVRGQYARLTIVGDGPQRPVVEAAAARDRTIEYKGKLEASQVDREMVKAAAICVPSLSFEAFPRVILEGMSHGRAVFVTDSRSLRSALPSGADEWLLVPTTIDAWRDRFATPLETLERIGQALRRSFVVDYSEAKLMARQVEFYKAIVDRA